MKKILIVLLPAVIAICALSCSKDLTAESPLIDMGGSDEGGSSGNPYWDWADKFPGIVSPNIERAFGVQVTVKGGYEPIAYAPDSAVLQSTGLYVASGDVVEIEVPGGTSDLQYQIGAGHKLLSGQLRQRYENVVTRGALHSGTNSVSSYFGGYLYFHKAPDARAFHEETVRKISKLHLYDCLRANKSLAAWGIEGRVPFLDTEFLDTAMRIAPEAKRPRDGRIEKWILRKAFEDLLPPEIVWRQKEQFSDGVGYGWIDSLKAFSEAAGSDREMAQAADRFPVNPPRNKEEYYYRTIFEEHFPSHTAAQCVPSVPSVACSTAEALAWDKAFRDMNEPSGRAVLGVHNTDLTHDTHRPETD